MISGSVIMSAFKQSEGRTNAPGVARSSTKLIETVSPSGATSKVVRCCPRITVMWEPESYRYSLPDIPEAVKRARREDGVLSGTRLDGAGGAPSDRAREARATA